MSTPATSPTYEELLHEEVARYYADPLGFVLAMYPWGEAGTQLEDEPGPDVWQRDFLVWLGGEVQARGFDGVNAVEPIRAAVSKGHGVGGSALAAWLVDWIMSTRPHCQGTVTANTITQLQTKTWAAVQRWTHLCKTGHWFEINADRMYRKGYRASWFCAPQSSKEENSESFAGQHAKNSTSFYVNDEDSGISEVIHKVEEGGLTDGEPMQFLFGNCTRSTGSFYQACFGSLRHRYHVVVVDSRTSRFTNKAQIDEWAEDYGEDSDFFRVRVRGLPPTAGDLQFIDSERVAQAQKRPLVTVFDDEAVVAGADFSDGGSAWNTVRFRRGLDGRSIPPIRVPGEHTRHDRSAYLARLAEILKDGVVDAQGQRHKVAMLFCDSAFGAPYVERLTAMGFKNVQEVRFGETHTPDRHMANMRAYMWSKGKDWLLRGCLPEKDTVLELDLTGPGYHLNKSDQLVLESKESMQKRNLASPDDGDAFMLTFAGAVQGKPITRSQSGGSRQQFQERGSPGTGWMQ